MPDKNKWSEWKIPIIIIIFIFSIVFSANYLNNSELNLEDKETEFVTLEQCYLCHQDGMVNNNSIIRDEGKIIPSKSASSKVNLSKSIEPIDLSNISDDDRMLIILIMKSDEVIRNDIKRAIDAANKNDYKIFGASGVTMKRDSQEYLNKTVSLNVSYSLKIIYNEYILVLENFYNAGKYIESGSRNSLSNDANISIDYIKEGTGHMNNIYDVLRISDMNMAKINNLSANK